MSDQSFKSKYEHLPKTELVSFDLPSAVMRKVRAEAKSEGISYARFVRRALEKVLSATESNEEQKGA